MSQPERTGYFLVIIIAIFILVAGLVLFLKFR